MLRLEGPLNWGINSQSQNVMISDSWWKQWQCRSERERTSTVSVGFIGSHPFHSRLLQVVPEARIATAARLQRPGFHGRNPWCQARSEGLGMFRVPVGSRFRAMVEKHFLKRLWSGILTKWEIWLCFFTSPGDLGRWGDVELQIIFLMMKLIMTQWILVYPIDKIWQTQSELEAISAVVFSSGFVLKCGYNPRFQLEVGKMLSFSFLSSEFWGLPGLSKIFSQAQVDLAPFLHINFRFRIHRRPLKGTSRESRVSGRSEWNWERGNTRKHDTNSPCNDDEMKWSRQPVIIIE